VAQHDDDSYFGHPYFALRREVSAAAIRRCRDVFRRLALAVATDQLANLRLLDIGCNTGAFLQSAAQEFGMIPVGIDVGRAAVEAAIRNGIEAYQARIEDAPAHLTGFPAITAIDLIEHVTQPLQFLQAIRKRLRPGGVVFIETPNAGSFVYRVGGILCNLTGAHPRKLFERLFPPQHIQYFTPGSLAALAETAGFEIVRIGTRVLPGPDIAASAFVRLAMASLQLPDRCTSRRILIWAVLRRNT
jgi:2-polyprenyl-3-methyl-5-hydroxy-6-metoxy-1,4-benzoquinol methylase